ncbi:MAG: tRNA pseudouridine(55) synthase TruB [Archangium gephyra]|uniref:tRNA pseudouridine synthase B n=1 Tax=Archangium gephyra TaxID=48 RepID=A0A2W5U492_9BACT|nr:MAG: tRNA pseudouridine(55) synthase TruB [Archangium gephyra]
MKRPPSAIWCAWKPVGATSTSLVDRFRQEHAGPWPLKVSHGGVLDPFAEGLVLLLVGSANRVFEGLHEAPKTYVAEVVFGVETDTGDAGGRAVLRTDQQPTVDQIEALLPSFLGWTDQVPPATSNKRVDGERAYVRAHRGEDVKLPAQQVYCHAVKRLDATRFELVVRGGYYVRSFATDLGRKLGCGAHLKTLVRTHIGPWSRETPLITGRAALPWLPSLVLSDAELGAVRSGAPLPGRPVTPPEWPLPVGFPTPHFGTRAFHQGKLVAVGSRLLPGGL